MKIHILSDLHNEHSIYKPSPAVIEFSDLIILAGDIDVKNRAIPWARAAFGDKVPVILVGGNHEFYGSHLEKMTAEMRSASCDRVRYLENEEWILSGVRFLGATCWTDYTSTGDSKLAKLDATTIMRDFKKIRTAGYRKVQTNDFAMLNHVSRNWLQNKLLNEPFGGKTVVVTHHAPSLLSIDSNAATEKSTYIESKSHIDAAYANSWNDLIRESNAALWVHGHTHHAVDYMIGNSRIISNPRGYPGEDTGFNSELLIDI